jgi:hypothetical protein
MTIDQRLEDAEFLWHSGRYEGAFLMTLIAFAATARKAYPKENPTVRHLNCSFKSSSNLVLL